MGSKIGFPIIPMELEVMGRDKPFEKVAPVSIKKSGSQSSILILIMGSAV